MQANEGAEKTTLVLDTSAAINLVATRLPAKILQTLPFDVAVTTDVEAELKWGMQFGHDNARQLQILSASGVVDVVRLNSECLFLHGTLIDDEAKPKLDVGEASTIAYAVVHQAIAVLDEKKATRLCHERFASTPVTSTAALLLKDTIRNELGRQGQANALFHALRDARMSVPRELEYEVVSLIGQKRAAICVSLPKRARRH